MENIVFKKLLFKVAFCTMACDGHIDEREIEEMKIIDKTTSFFHAIDLSNELSLLVEEFYKKGTKVIEELFADLKENKLNPIQELLVLEVALRIINADDKHDENELMFIRLLRAKLELHDETINDRFGKVDILNTSDYLRTATSVKTDNEFAKSINLPELSDFELVNLDIEKS